MSACAATRIKDSLRRLHDEKDNRSKLGSAFMFTNSDNLTTKRAYFIDRDRRSSRRRFHMLTRWNRVDDVFNFQHEVDRLFNQFWSDLPTRPATTTNSSPSFHVNASEDGWRIDIPIPGIDPKDVTLDVAGNTLSVRAEAR